MNFSFFRDDRRPLLEDDDDLSFLNKKSISSSSKFAFNIPKHLKSPGLDPSLKTNAKAKKDKCEKEAANVLKKKAKVNI
jgi:hypothetical protein